MGEKELQAKLTKSDDSLKKAGEIIKELKNKINSGLGKGVQEQIEKLIEDAKEKDLKIIELATSVAKTQDPPRRVKLNVKYVNKYTKRQLEALEKNGIVITGLQEEPEIKA